MNISLLLRNEHQNILRTKEQVKQAYLKKMNISLLLRNDHQNILRTKEQVKQAYFKKNEYQPTSEE
jgi:hypothetical protein